MKKLPIGPIITIHFRKTVTSDDAYAISTGLHCRLSHPRTIGRLKRSTERLQERERNEQAYAKHPALLRMLELETLTDLARNANARIYIGFEKHVEGDGVEKAE